MKIEIYDTTLRDGAQSAGIAFTDEDRIRVIRALDEMGADYIEIGNFAANEKETDFLRRAGTLALSHARLCAFGSTRRAGTAAADDPDYRRAAEMPVPTVTLFGKSWRRQVCDVLGTTPEENLAMIADSVAYFKAAGKEVIFDAEHFFDGYAEHPAYALAVLDAARIAGADALVLCDTRGGMLPDVVGMAAHAAVEHLPDVRIGIHCHNDVGMAVASTVSAVLSGVCQVQGTVSGIGERCGNANLNTLIPLLQLKLGYDCVTSEQLAKLTRLARYINEVENRRFDESEPFVGGHAFAHKAGMHIDAVMKNPGAFEHMDPSLVGNQRSLLVSDIAGRAAVQEKMETLLPGIEKDDPKVKAVLQTVKEREARGFRYENAEASLSLLIREAIGCRRRFFELNKYQVTVNESNNESYCTALIHITVDGREEITAAQGEGPVNAMDIALRKALGLFYPEITAVRLTDYKVRVINSGDATASVVCVMIESADDVKVWRTVGVSEDIIDASWQALADAVEYKLYETRGEEAPALRL